MSRITIALALMLVGCGDYLAVDRTSIVGDEVLLHCQPGHRIEVQAETLTARAKCVRRSEESR
jgi:hypothetical protein